MCLASSPLLCMNRTGSRAELQLSIACFPPPRELGARGSHSSCVSDPPEGTGQVFAWFLTMAQVSTSWSRFHKHVPSTSLVESRFWCQQCWRSEGRCRLAVHMSPGPEHVWLMCRHRWRADITEGPVSYAGGAGCLSLAPSIRNITETRALMIPWGNSICEAG